MARRPSAWRGLGLFWLLVLAAGGLAGGVLQWLGPPPHPAEHAAEPAETHAAEAHAPQTHAPETHAAETHAPGHPAAPDPAVARPDPALLERSAAFPQLMLPHAGANGALARLRYAASVPPVPPGARRVALLVVSFGKSDKDSRDALVALPAPVSLGVSVDSAATAAALLDAARVAGHEVLVSVPMEPDGYPLQDEGTRSLRTGLSAEENRVNLEWSLGQVPGAVGATGASDGMRGERFAGLQAAFDPALDEIVRRGLLYIDSRPGVPSRPGLPDRSIDVVLDDSQARAEIEARLAALERVARDKGSAIGLVGQIRPVTLDRLAVWIKGLSEHGLVLVPVSSLVETSR